MPSDRCFSGRIDYGIENWFGPGVADEVACSEMVCWVPSGSVSANAIVSPSFGLDARLTEIELGLPGDPTVGPVTTAPVRFELTPASLNPNGEPNTSSLIETVVGVGYRL